MLKKAGFVAATAVALTLVGGTAAFAQDTDSNATDKVTFSDAYYTFIEGGGAVGYGAASLVAGAFTGIANTPALVLFSLDED